MFFGNVVKTNKRIKESQIKSNNIVVCFYGVYWFKSPGGS